jgi:hypothetical protein
MQMATPEGLEPPTSALGKPCSIRLSYGVTDADLAARRARGKRLAPPRDGIPAPRRATPKRPRPLIVVNHP